MAKVEEKGRPNYNNFDSLDTAVLEAILQADFDAPEAEQMEAEKALYIANLLAERQKVELKDAKTLMNEFFEYYYPCDELYGLDDESELEIKTQNDNIQKKDSDKKVISFFPKGLRRFASAVAVLVLFMFVGTVTAYALGYNPIRYIGRWTDEQFWLERDIPTKELIEVVAVYSDNKLVPQWLPDGYVSEEPTVSGLDSYMRIEADFYSENTDNVNKIYIDYRFLSDDDNKPLYEKDIKEVREYTVHNISHYIMTNLDNRVIVWRNGNVEGSIKGDFSLAEAKQIINSIYGE
jgi:hypothetical protein